MNSLYKTTVPDRIVIITKLLATAWKVDALLNSIAISRIPWPRPKVIVFVIIIGKLWARRWINITTIGPVTILFVLELWIAAWPMDAFLDPVYAGSLWFVIVKLWAAAWNVW